MPNAPLTQIAPEPWKPLRGAVANRYNGNVYVRLVKVVFNEILGYDQSWMGMWKSTDDGATWAQVDADKILGDYNSTNSTFIPGCGTVDPADPATIHVSYNYYVFSVGVQTSQLNIARFDCVTDTWLADTLGPDFSAPRYSVGYAQNSQLGFRSNSTVVLFYRHTQEVPPITLNIEYRVWTVAGGEQDLSTVLASGGAEFLDWTLLGSVIIDPNNIAKFFYVMSASGTSINDSALMYRELDASDALGVEVVAVDYALPGNKLIGRYGGVSVAISTVENTVYGLADFTNFPDFNPTMLFGPSTAVPATTEIDLTNTLATQAVTKIGDVVYAVWPYSNTSGSRLQGIVFGEFYEGVWYPAVTVNDGTTGEPDFIYCTINGVDDADGEALLFVLENWDDETAWYVQYGDIAPPDPPDPPSESGGGLGLSGGTYNPLGPKCTETVPQGLPWYVYLQVGRQHAARAPIPNVCVPPPVNKPRRFGTRVLRCVP